MLNQELAQLKDLNGQLMNRIERLEEHEAINLDQHLEYEHIQKGFDKICKGFSDKIDPSLGNLSVRGATKKMLLNLQHFSYEQIAMLKVEYTHRLMKMREPFAEEVENLNEALAEACKQSIQHQTQANNIIEAQTNSKDNSSSIIEELQSKLGTETNRADIMTSNFSVADTELKIIQKSYGETSSIITNLEHNLARETDLRLGLKERLEEVDTKYQNISVSTMHSNISSLKSQLDLLRLEDAKKLYEKDKKLKKAIQALKQFKDNRKTFSDKVNEIEENDEQDDESSPHKEMGDDPANYNVESDDEDPEEIERNIKKLLQEEEDDRKEKHDAINEEPPGEIRDDEAYMVNRDGFEQAIQNNPVLASLY
jgi:hypothetical protein